MEIQVVGYVSEVFLTLWEVCGPDEVSQPQGI